MSDPEIAREIAFIIKDHLDAIKKETHARVLKLENVDRDKAWEQIEQAVDAYGGDMITDATYWLKHQVMDYSSIRWNEAVKRRLKGN